MIIVVLDSSYTISDYESIVLIIVVLDSSSAISDYNLLIFIRIASTISDYK